MQLNPVFIVIHVSQSVAVLQVGNGVSITTVPSSIKRWSNSTVWYSYIVLRIMPEIFVST